MIHDAKVEVTCDGEGCFESTLLDMQCRFDKWSGKCLGYDLSDSEAEKVLRVMGWIVLEGKHFCCDACALNAREC